MKRLFILLWLTLITAITLNAQEAPVTVTIDVDQPLHTISPGIYGVNHGPWAFIPVDFVDDVPTLGITYLRFPGGNWGDINQIRSYQLNDVVFWADRMGADLSVSVNLERGTPEDAVELVEYVLEEEIDVRYWSIGNEPNLFGEGWDTVYYNERWREFAEAMLAVDPSIQFVGPDISQYYGDPARDPRDDNGVLWLDSFLEANGDLVDVVSVHRYPFPAFSEPVATFEQMRENTLEWQAMIGALRDKVQAITGEDKPIGVMEVNSYWSSAVGLETSPDSYLNAVWWADVLGQLMLADTDYVAYFSLQSGGSIGGYGLYAQFDVRPTYYVYRMYQHFGDQLVSAESSEVFVNVYASVRDDGDLAVMLVNLTDDDQNVDLNLAGSAQMMALTAETAPEDFSSVSLDEPLDLEARSVMLLVIAQDE